MTMEVPRITIAREAADWFVRNRGGLRSTSGRADFAAWLRSSPLHVEEYLRTAVASRNIQAVASKSDMNIDDLVQGATASTGESMVVSLFGRQSLAAPRLHPPWTRQRMFASVAALAVLVVCARYWPDLDGQHFGVLPTSYGTAHAEQRSWLLPDGTSVSLDSDTHIVVSYNGRERVVRINRGQALFHVAHEAKRRFRVVAGDTGVIAIGTAFDVVRTSSSTRVTVVEGKVAVFTGEAPRVSPQAVLPSQSLKLIAGEQTRVDDHAQPTRPAAVNVQQAVAWVQRQISFDQKPLGEVADEFNRYSGLPIVIENNQLRGILISGVFSAYDTDSFVMFISRLDGVKVERLDDRILIASTSR